jgi:hypothetical protein
MKTAMDSIKDLEVEVKQWQSRVDFAKSENSRLTKENEALKQVADGIRAAATQHAEKERLTIHNQLTKVSEAQMSLDVQKAEFAQILGKFKTDSAAFEKERKAALDAKNNYNDMTEKARSFVLLVKREAEKL